MDQFGDYRQVVSLPNPPIEDFATGGQGRAGARRQRCHGRALRQTSRPFRRVRRCAVADRRHGLGREAKRAINDLGAAGVQIFSPLAGRPLDEPAFEPLFAAMAQLDRPIWLHPARTAAMPDYAAEQKSRFEMWWCSAGPMTRRSPWRGWVLRTVRPLSELQIVTHHLGGMIPYYDGRVGPGLEVLGARTSDEDYSRSCRR